MPDADVVAYYEAVAGKILPFLRGRKVAVRHHFGSTVVFRRHRAVGKRKTWLTISARRELLESVRQHGYEFFPHLEGERDLWFALDIDVRAVPLDLGKLAVRSILEILAERNVEVLLTFSGGNGFHVRWAFARGGLPRRVWPFLRAIVRALRDETERRLQASPSRAVFYRHIPRGDPITELNAVDRAAQRSILFDELILKRQATIRAPFSLHMKHRWVAVPVTPDRLLSFRPERDATMGAARVLPAVRLPRNQVSLFRTTTWNL